MALTSGTRIGSCEVVGPIGSGGMGDVYRARDTRLNRDVAIKTLPDVFADDPERLSRFEREAQLLAALNHPHIAQVYGVNDQPPALILELVPGASLADRLKGGAVPIREALAIARQIAEALEAAHEKGIIHRDLKPGNVMLTPDGQVKVLDFGLARMSEAEAQSNPSHSPTLTFAGTQLGVILGTAGYMAPEQAKGRVADRRSDVWAFGCVVYELLTGTRAFDGEDISDTLAAVLRSEPDWTKLPAAAPPRLAQLLRRCLDKDRRQRIPDISVARYEIEHALAGESSAVAAAGALHAPPRPRSLLPVAAAVALTAGAAALAGFTLRPAPPAAAIVRFDVRPPAGGRILNRSTAGALDLALSRDGTQIAYRVSTSDGDAAIALRRLDQAASTIVPGTTGAASATFSPDGQALAFFAEAKLKVLTLGTSTPFVAADATGVNGLDWIDNDTIVFPYRNGLYRVSRIGGSPEPVAEPDAAAAATVYRYPEMTPDGGTVLFVAERGGQRDIMARSLASGEQKVVVENATYPKYLASGHLVYLLGGRTVAARFDASSLTLSGTPVPMDEGIVERLTGSANYDLSPGGTFVSMTGSSMPYVGRFTWFTRDGRIVGRIGSEDLPYPRYPRISPDGRRLAATVGPGIRGQLWVFDLAGTAQPLKLTSAEHNVWPTWMAGGEMLIFARIMTQTSHADSSRSSLVTLPPDGSSLEPRLVESVARAGRVLTTVSPDGGWMVYSVVGASTGQDLMVKSLTQPAPGKPWVAEPVEEADPAFSPDGKWVAYTSMQTGTLEVWVRPFPGPGAPLRVSPNGGREPVWARNGKELYYQEQDTLMAAAVISTGRDLRFGLPAALFAGTFVRSEMSTPRTYDVAPDGRFLMIENKPNPDSSMLNVAIGWGELLRAKVR